MDCIVLAILKFVPSLMPFHLSGKTTTLAVVQKGVYSPRFIGWDPCINILLAQVILGFEHQLSVVFDLLTGHIVPCVFLEMILNVYRPTSVESCYHAHICNVPNWDLCG